MNPDVLTVTPRECHICGNTDTEGLRFDDLSRSVCRNSRACLKRWRQLRQEALRRDADGVEVR